MEKQNEKFFDEKSPVWIKAFKIYSIILFFTLLVASLALGVLGLFSILTLTGIPFLDGIVFLAIGLEASFIELICNMLIVQFFNNINIIREKIEKQ